MRTGMFCQAQAVMVDTPWRALVFCQDAYSTTALFFLLTLSILILHRGACFILVKFSHAMSLQWVNVNKHLQNFELQVHKKHLGSKVNKQKFRNTFDFAIKQRTCCDTGQLSHMKACHYVKDVYVTASPLVYMAPPFTRWEQTHLHQRTTKRKLRNTARDFQDSRDELRNFCVILLPEVLVSYNMQDRNNWRSYTTFPSPAVLPAPGKTSLQTSEPPIHFSLYKFLLLILFPFMLIEVFWLMWLNSYQKVFCFKNKISRLKLFCNLQYRCFPAAFGKQKGEPRHT